MRSRRSRCVRVEGDGVSEILTFRSDFQQVADGVTWHTEMVRREPGLFSYDPLALPVGAELAKQFVTQAIAYCGPIWASAVLDTRVHMLKAGFWPCIPGWHHDDVERTRPDGQPNYRDQTRRARHLLCVVDCGTGSLTEFACGTFRLREPPLGETVYQVWDRTLEKLHKRGAFEPIPVTNGALYAFNDHAFHRGTPATSQGWRWFGRLTLDGDRLYANEVRTQTQVYLSDPSVGW